MFPDHILAFGDAYHDDARLRTKRKLGRTDQVADVLDKNQLQVRQIDLAQRFPNKVRVEMTAVDRGNLDNGHILFRDRIRVGARCCVAVKNCDSKAVFQPFHELGRSGWFSRIRSRP